MHACSLQHANDIWMSFVWVTIGALFPTLSLRMFSCNPQCPIYTKDPRNHPQRCVPPRFSEFFSLVISNILIFFGSFPTTSHSRLYVILYQLVRFFSGSILFSHRIDSIYPSFLEVILQTGMPHNTVNIIVIPKVRIFPLRIRMFRSNI